MRPDNMGDLIMSGPAIRALRGHFGAKITVLTSSMARGIVKHMPEIDDAIIFDPPWVKNDDRADAGQINKIVSIIKDKRFDAAVIFTVYSQNPLPTAMMAYMAGIPKILAYCRENPYGLLTDWVPDQEPYSVIKHQVRRDLDLVKSIAAIPPSEDLSLQVNDNVWPLTVSKLASAGIKLGRRSIIVHAGVSEHKRRYPFDKWVETGRRLIAQLDCQILLTGALSEKKLTDRLQSAIGQGSHSIAGLPDLEEFISLVKNTPLIVSANTGAVHIAAAVGTPVVVLYAQTNPQHIPWNVPCRVLPFPVKEDIKSRNEVIRFVDKKLYRDAIDIPGPDAISHAVTKLLTLTDLSSVQSPEIQNDNWGIAAS